MSIEINRLLVASPDKCGGRLRLEGTRITVNQIVICYLQGFSAEEIADQYLHLSLAQIYTALAYYHANTQEIDTALERERAEAEQLEQEYKQTLKQA